MLRRHQLPCQLIASGEDDLDILPPGAGKGQATLHLAGVLGFDRAQLIVAGDSANDLAMFQVAPRAIAVGNGSQGIARTDAGGRCVRCPGALCSRGNRGADPLPGAAGKRLLTGVP